MEAISHDRHMLSEWFSIRREIFVTEAAQGAFGKKVDATALKDEFRRMAMELDPDNPELEMWLASEADLLIHVAAKGLLRPTIDVQYVNMAFKKLERHLWNAQKKRAAIAATSSTGSAKATTYSDLDDQALQERRVEQSNDTPIALPANSQAAVEMERPFELI